LPVNSVSWFVDSVVYIERQFLSKNKYLFGIAEVVTWNPNKSRDPRLNEMFREHTISSGDEPLHTLLDYDTFYNHYQKQDLAAITRSAYDADECIRILIPVPMTLVPYDASVFYQNIYDWNITDKQAMTPIKFHTLKLGIRWSDDKTNANNGNETAFMYKPHYSCPSPPFIDGTTTFVQSLLRQVTVFKNHRKFDTFNARLVEKPPFN